MQSIDHTTEPVLEEIRDIADGVAVREEVPATGAVTVVVEPRAEDKIGGNAQDGTE